MKGDHLGTIQTTAFGRYKLMIYGQNIILFKN